MIKMYLKFFLTLIFAISLNYSAEAQTAIFDAEVETESEVEAEAGVGKTAGAVAIAAGAAANFPNSKAAVMLSGSLAQMVTTPAPTRQSDSRSTMTNQRASNNSTMNLDDGTPPRRDNNIFLAESEVEIEAETEVEVNNGSAIAVGGTAAGASGISASKYTIANGDILLWPSNAETSVVAVTSTSAKVSTVNIVYTEDTSTPISGSGDSTNRLLEAENNETPDLTSETQRMLPNGVVYATPADVPVTQVETDTETEVEVEAEVEAETALGAAGAVATGGAATAVAGDYGVAISSSSVITSVSTSVVNDIEPILFNSPEAASNSAENTGSGNENGGTVNRSPRIIMGESYSLNRNAQAGDAPALAEVPQEANGKGLNNFETEAESETEVEIEVDNGSAAAAAAAIGGSGANGVASSVSGSSTTAASTSTADENGTAVRENDEIFFSEKRRIDTDEAQPASSATAEAAAGADAESADPATGSSANGVGIGDANAYGQITIEDTGVHTRSSNNDSNPVVGSRTTNRENLFNPSGLVQINAIPYAASVRRMNSENEAEVEAEAEAEVGFNAAAAAAGASAVQGKNGVLPVDSQTSSSSSTSTKVFDGAEQTENQNDAFVPSGATIYPDFGVDYSDYEYETETETEAEAEVGFNAAAVAVSASAGGYDDIKIETKHATTPYAAAAAAAAGFTVTTSITMPAGTAAGDVTATATAEDPMNRGVSVAVAVAGVPTEDGIENEMEEEAEGDGFATVSVTIFTDPANAASPRLLGGYNPFVTTDSGQGAGGSQSGTLGETESEAEAEAEAGYGVAAAAASSGAAGKAAISEAFTSTSTLAYSGGFDFTDNLFALTEAGIVRSPEDPTIAEIRFNGFGYTSFSIQQKNANGDFVEIGTVERATPGIWETYLFTINNVPRDTEQEFKIVPFEDSSDEVILILPVDPTLSADDITLDIIGNPFPNPVSNMLNIPLNIQSGERFEATVIDVTGKVIDRINSDNLGSGQQIMTWIPNVSLADGMYIIRLNSQSRAKNFRIILRR